MVGEEGWRCGFATLLADDDEGGEWRWDEVWDSLLCIRTMMMGRGWKGG